MFPKTTYTYWIYHGSQLVKLLKLLSNSEKFTLKFINITFFAPDAPKNKDLELMTCKTKWGENDCEKKIVQMSKEKYINGPCRSRTCDLCVISTSLWPTELIGHSVCALFSVQPMLGLCSLMIATRTLN